MKKKYHSKGIGKNKEIKEQRNKPLPIGLMKMGYEYDKSKRCWIERRGNEENTFNTEVI